MTVETLYILVTDILNSFIFILQMQHTTFKQLLKDKKKLKFLMDESYDLCNWCNPIAYHTNNISSMDWSPQRIWNFISDIIYWMYDTYNRDFSDLIPYTIEKIRYKDPDNFTKNMDKFFKWLINIPRSRYF